MAGIINGITGIISRITGIISRSFIYFPGAEVVLSDSPDSEVGPNEGENNIAGKSFITV